MLQPLQARQSAVVFSGNSIMRHVFFRFAAFLRGVTADNFTQSGRQAEKELCTKEISPVARKEAGGFMKPFCKSGCCGVCSCASSVGDVPLYFVWQQEWYNARMRRIWDELFSMEALHRRNIVLVMNAGLVNARVQSLGCIVGYQFPLLREYLLTGMPSNVRVVYLASPPAQGEEADAWMGAQDGMLRVLFSAIPPTRRPVWLDARMALSQWVDYIDVNHFGGRSAQVVIEALIHLVLHWEVLYGEGGRGREYERRMTKALNRYDTAGPSGEARLRAVHAEIDASVSPPPAHSKREDCLR